MSSANIIINVSNESHSHSNGLSGTWIVPGRRKEKGEEFAILVVYPTIEIQDIGEQRRVNHRLKAKPLALDIMGMRSDATAHSPGVRSGTEKWGLLLCEAEPDIPRSLENATEAEIEYLNANRPDVKYKFDNTYKINVAINQYEPGVAEQLRALSDMVAEERAKFERYCLSLVQKREIATAKRNLLIEDQRLVAEGDRMWARPMEQQNINEHHRNSCARLGQERPWCYVPQQLIECPGCGKSIKENILSCPHCGGWLEEGIEELRVMPTKQRARLMYPERYTDPVKADGKKG